jgi:ABC-type branched-subunit amino acid transport system ATPase component/ABC-type branched-subunit amino acid transport system permease subunit
MSVGTFVLGMLNGMTIGLLAVGMVLVYKSNRFLNLAHAQLGTVSALLLAKWVLDWHVNWWVAFGLSLVVGTVTGLLVDRFLVGRLRKRTTSPIALLLLTIGISQILLALTYIPSLGPDPESGNLFPQPFTSSVRIGHVVLTGMSVLTMALVPALVVALAAFLRFTSLGRQVRAAASNPDAARLCGVSVGRVSAITWGLAGGLSAVSAILQAPNQPSFNVATLGPYLLMLTLGAAALGAFVSLPAALGGGLLLGMISQVVAAETSSASKAEVAVFLTILAIVLFRGKAISRVFAVSGAAVDERPVTKVPPVLQRTAIVRYHQVALVAVAAFVAVIAPLLPILRSESQRFDLVLIAVFALLGVALTMLVGWGGQVSLGHFAVVGVAAYLTARWSPHGWSLPVLFVATGVIGALLMVAIGIPALRVRGLTLAVTTLGFAVITPDWLLRQGWLGSANSFGLTVTPPRLPSGLGTPHSQLAIYYLALVVLVIAVASGACLRRSTPGRLIVAVRDNERAAATFGVTPATVKLAILAVSGFWAGVAGVLWADAWRIASPAQFGGEMSLAILAIPVIGGLGSLSGAVAGAVALYVPVFFLGPLVTPIFGDFGNNLGFQLFLGGFGLVATMLKFPNGIAGAAQAGWQSFLNRRAASASVRPTLADAHPLEAEGVVVRFGGVVALDELTIHVRPGEIVGLIGPNGAGKTTLMNVISGTLPMQQGSVRLFGAEVGDLPPDMRAGHGLARTFQDASLFAGLTVRETIQVALAKRHKVGIIPAMVAAPWVRTGERTSRLDADEVLARFGLTTWATSLTAELSTGTRRICDLAAQVAARPKLILLDEPTGGVAQREAEAFGPLLRQIRDELDCAVLIVEHDMPLLMGLCDRIYAMEAGRVIASGTPAEVREDPAVVASYLGTDSHAVERSGRGRRRQLKSTTADSMRSVP